MPEAASLPLVGITSWNALVDRANIKAGERVLIHAGTGGVGHFALQLAKAMGAETHSTISNDLKANLAKDLGADEVINYGELEVEEYVQKFTSGIGYDLVFDTVGENALISHFGPRRNTERLYPLLLVQNMT